MLLVSETLLCRQKSSSQSYGFSSSHVWMWELDHKESWAPKNWCFWTVVLEKTLESSSNQSILKEISSEYSLEGLMLKLPILWPSYAKNWLIWKDPDAGKDWRQEEKGMTEDEMVGWHHWLDGHEFGQAPGVGDGQGSLLCCSPWDHKESDMTKQLNWRTNDAEHTFMCSLIPHTHSLKKCLFKSFVHLKILVVNTTQP